MTNSFNAFDEILQNERNIVGNVPKSNNDFNAFDQLLKDE